MQSVAAMSDCFLKCFAASRFKKMQNRPNKNRRKQKQLSLSLYGAALDKLTPELIRCKLSLSGSELSLCGVAGCTGYAQAPILFYGCFCGLFFCAWRAAKTIKNRFSTGYAQAAALHTLSSEALGNCLPPDTYNYSS